MKRIQLLVLAAVLGGGALLLASCEDDELTDFIAGDIVVARDDFFAPKVDTVTVGSTVSWLNRGLHDHTTDSDTGLWDGEIGPTQHFSVRFDEVGTFPYHCDFHGAAGGVGMSGIIVVVP